jgi:hypothetical protein
MGAATPRQIDRARRQGEFTRALPVGPIGERLDAANVLNRFRGRPVLRVWRC